jgi:hypothetical protein
LQCLPIIQAQESQKNQPNSKWNAPISQKLNVWVIGSHQVPSIRIKKMVATYMIVFWHLILGLVHENRWFFLKVALDFHGEGSKNI